MSAALPVGDRAPRIDEIIGEANALKGRWEEALACYERAAADGKTLAAGLAWRIGRIHFDRGRPEEALDVFARGRVDGSEPGDEALLLAGTASALLSRGELESSRRVVADALGRANDSGDQRALAAAHNVAMIVALRTDPSTAEAHYRVGLEAAERAGDMLQAIRIRSNDVAQLIQEGSYEDALVELELAVHLSEVAGVPHALAFALLKRGETHLCLGQLELALTDFEAARSLYDRVGSSRAFGALMEIGEIYRERGDRALARAALESALRGATQVDDVQVRAYATASLARVLAERGARPGPRARRRRCRARPDVEPRSCLRTALVRLAGARSGRPRWGRRVGSGERGGRAGARRSQRLGRGARAGGALGARTRALSARRGGVDLA